MKLLNLSFILLFPLLSLSQVKAVEKTSYRADVCPEWHFILDYINSDSIVCLGEESHWIETYLELKNGLVKTLHQKAGFDVLIFESGFVNSFIGIIQNRSNKDQMKETLYDIWQTNAVLDLMNYIDQAKQKNVPIRQLGCDIKGPKSFQFSRFLNSTFQKINPEYAKTITALDSNLIELRCIWEPEIGKAYRHSFFDQSQYSDFQRMYTELLDSIEIYKDKIMLDQHLGHREFLFFKRCAENRIFLLELMQLPSYQEKHKFRDRKMAENISWIIDIYTPNSKYMIWGADLHISKNAHWENLGPEWNSNLSMIECLSRIQTKKIYSIGIKPIKRISKTVRKNLKRLKSCFYFIDLKGVEHPAYAELKKEFEALIVCRKTNKIDKYKVN